MTRIFLSLCIVFTIELITANSFGHVEILKNYAAIKESSKITRYNFEGRIRNGLKIPYDEKIKSCLGNISEFRTKINFVNSNTSENNKKSYYLNDKFLISHHIMIMKKGNHYPSLFV